MAFHHCVGSRFPYEDRFDEDVAILVPEMGKIVRRKTYPYVCEAYAYYIEENDKEREIFCESPRHYAFWAIPKIRSIIPQLPMMFLYNDVDGVYYYHVFWEEKHYAVPLRRCVSDNDETIELLSDNGACKIVGIEVTAFEGMEIWENEYAQISGITGR